MATHRTCLVLAPGDAGRAVSSAEFVDPRPYGREAGRPVVAAPDGKGHDDGSEPIRGRLGADRIAPPEVVEVVSEARIRVGGGGDRIADIAVDLVRPEGGPDRPDRVPDLIVEVVGRDRGSRRRDSVLERREDLGLGVRDYVIVDRFPGRFSTSVLGPGGGARRALRRGDVFRTAPPPGFEPPHDEAF